ncbi:MAG: Nif3-like dinuclear metal center hexameric protein, partial [Desulforhopalus sp.]
CGGSGSDLAPTALRLDADVYLSAEIKHSTAIWAVENNFCIIDGTHYATEKPSVELLVKKLREACDRNDWNIEILQTELEVPPFVWQERSYPL